jgi:nitroreductase
MNDKQEPIPGDGKFIYPGVLVHRANTDMLLEDAIVTRRTVRSYRDEPVPLDVFQHLVSLCTHAPTACNEQKWRVIYIDDRELLRELYLRGSAAFLKNVKQAFIVLYNNQIDNSEYRDDIQSGAAFINTFSLIAHSYGIGSCWVAHLPNKAELRRLLGIHRYYDPIALVTFGYYREKVKVVVRKKQSIDLVSHNKFAFPNLVFSREKNIAARRMVRWVYYKIPAFARKKLRKYSLPFEKKFYFEVYD